MRAIAIRLHPVLSASAMRAIAIRLLCIALLDRSTAVDADHRPHRLQGVNQILTLEDFAATHQPATAEPPDGAPQQSRTSVRSYHPSLACLDHGVVHFRFRENLLKVFRTPKWRYISDRYSAFQGEGLFLTGIYDMSGAVHQALLSSSAGGDENKDLLHSSGETTSRQARGPSPREDQAAHDDPRVLLFAQQYFIPAHYSVPPASETERTSTGPVEVLSVSDAGGPKAKQTLMDLSVLCWAGEAAFNLAANMAYDTDFSNRLHLFLLFSHIFVSVLFRTKSKNPGCILLLTAL